jgi:hypothetical protein
MEGHHPRKLFDQVRDDIRAKHYSHRIEQAYLHWNIKATMMYSRVLSLRVLVVQSPLDEPPPH